MNDQLHAQMSDLTIAERLGNRAVTSYTVTGIANYADIQRIQAFCDAQNRKVLWRHQRNGANAVLDVVALCDVFVAAPGGAHRWCDVCGWQSEYHDREAV